MKSKVFSTALRIIISLGALALIIYFMREHLNEAIHILQKDVMWKWMIIALAGYLLANVFLAFRLQVVLSAQSIFIKIKEMIYLVFVGLFFSLFLPSAVGGDLAKGYYVYKYSGSKIGSTTSIILDRLIGFVALMTMAGISVALFSREFEDPRVQWIVYFFVGAMGMTVLFFMNKTLATQVAKLGKFIPSEKIKKSLVDFYHTMHAYKEHKSVLVKSLGLAFVAQVFFILMHYWCARSLGVELSPLLFFVMVPVVTIASMAPSLGGLGVREAGMIFMFSRFMPSERALALALLVDLVVYGVNFSAGIVYALKGGLKENISTVPENTDRVGFD